MSGGVDACYRAGRWRPVLFYMTGRHNVIGVVDIP